jgi:ribonuclease P protein component
MTIEPAKAKLTFRPRQRLTHATQFAQVYGARCKATRGPMVVHARANDVPYCRLGLSIGKRLGNAVKRSRFKRLIREAFRLDQRSLPTRESDGKVSGYDLVVSLYPHEELELAAYRGLLVQLATRATASAEQRRGH